MDRFWELLEQNILIQSTLAFACLMAIIYLSVTGREVPDVLVNAFLLILGFYFGNKAHAEAIRYISEKRG